MCSILKTVILLYEVFFIPRDERIKQIVKALLIRFCVCYIYLLFFLYRIANDSKRIKESSILEL